MKDIVQNLEKTLGIPVSNLLTDFTIAKVLWCTLRVRDANDCENALLRISQHVKAIRRELSREPAPSDQDVLTWIDAAAIRLKATMRLTSRAWTELDQVILEATEAICSLAYESRERRSEGGPLPPRLKDMLAPRLDGCIARLQEALDAAQVLQKQAREELVLLLREARRQ